MKDWTEDLISALVDCEADSDIIETLRDLGDQGRLGGWRIEPLDIPGGFPWCLSDGQVKVALSKSRKNIAMTSSVLPFEQEEDAKSCNKYITKLHTVFNSTNGVVNSSLI
ncbi:MULTISPECIES: hypothetical protein [Klebsiella]|uniref:hypothetical protein n=1 Tax=Klebsiella TaxID=570 RepID=UPI000A26BC89|nr:MULTISPECIES: hypothetical protein [Klebsiella]HCF7790827.1 hypothetical protein [Klebsiella variicola subsp. variicola]EIX9340653.1 hypothetical protein [Klebsiella pneumoniae]EKU9049629.1 hypothetical protein [Klebsiella pneumoniae]ELA1549157.1 hypothetical protein [Klebsiella pneumoniae]MBK2471189.1 hypothetical protein [Klebsiella quasipneumoniae]